MKCNDKPHNGKSLPHDLYWLWTSEEIPSRNNFVEFRRTLSIPEGQTAFLHLTADSKYFLFLNGKRAGMGPSRCWPNSWEYDTYSLTEDAVSNTCTIAVLVNHYGNGTMQYLPSDPGYGVAIEVVEKSGKSVWLPLGDWKVRVSPSALSKVPRMSMQMAFDEVYDARFDDGWVQTKYDDSTWSSAIRIESPHESLKPRSIPFLSEERVRVKEILKAELVSSTRYHWTINLSPYLKMNDASAAPMIYKGFLMTHILSPVAQSVRLMRPHWYHQGPMYLNGNEISALEPGFAKPPIEQLADLQKGWNLLLIPLPSLDQQDGTFAFGPALFSQFSLNVDCDEEVEWRAFGPTESCIEDSPWAFVGPFAFTEQEFEDIRSRIHNAVVITSLQLSSDATADECIRICDVMKQNYPPEGLELNQVFARNAEYLQPISLKDIFPEDSFLTAITDRPNRELNFDYRETILDGGAKAFVLNEPIDSFDQRILIDFGFEFVGDQWIEVEANAGTILDFHYFEFIQKDGRHNYAEDMNNTFRYICREGRQRYQSIVRRGYRYCWLTVRKQTGAVTFYDLDGCFSAYPQKSIGSFSCSDPLLNKIWEVGHHTLRCCSEDAYTDCPTYEQVFWVGDGRNEALVDWMVNGDSRLWRRCLFLAAKSLERSPIIESHVPSSQRSILPAWSFLWMRSCREYLLYTGDYETSHELLGFLIKNVEGVKSFINDSGLFEIRAWNMFDWAEMDTPDEGVVTHNNCFLVLALEEAAEFAGWLGEDDKAKEFMAIGAGVRDAINRHLWDEETGAYVDCVHKNGNPSKVFSQQTQTVALRAKIPTDERVERCRDRVMNPPEEFVKAGSPFFQFFILEIFSEENRIQELLDNIRKDWGFMINEGATTFWEMWSLKSGRLTRSHCHGWSSAPTFFLSSKILGLEPVEPGYRKVRFQPFAGDLEQAEGTIPTPHGLARVSCEDGAWKLSLPEGIEVIGSKAVDSLAVSYE